MLVLRFKRVIHSIQWIAGKFHERSYAERIAEQKAAVKALVVMYRNSQDIPGRTDTLRAGHLKKGSVNPRHFFKQALKGVRNAATTVSRFLVFKPYMADQISFRRLLRLEMWLPK